MLTKQPACRRKHLSELREFAPTVDAITLKGKWDRVQYRANRDKYAERDVRDWEAIYKKGKVWQRRALSALALVCVCAFTDAQCSKHASAWSASVARRSIACWKSIVGACRRSRNASPLS